MSSNFILPFTVPTMPPSVAFGAAVDGHATPGPVSAGRGARGDEHRVLPGDRECSCQRSARSSSLAACPGRSRGQKPAQRGGARARRADRHHRGHAAAHRRRHAGLTRPGWLLAGVAAGVCSSVIPYVTDQLAMTRSRRVPFALILSILPASATVIGLINLA
jgi:hypothetical protein